MGFDYVTSNKLWIQPTIGIFLDHIIKRSAFASDCRDGIISSCSSSDKGVTFYLKKSIYPKTKICIYIYYEDNMRICQELKYKKDNLSSYEEFIRRFVSVPMHWALNRNSLNLNVKIKKYSSSHIASTISIRL